MKEIKVSFGIRIALKRTDVHLGGGGVVEGEAGGIFGGVQAGDGGD